MTLLNAAGHDHTVSESYHKPCEKVRHFSYSDISVWQQSACGQMDPDNRRYAARNLTQVGSQLLLILTGSIPALYNGHYWGMKAGLTFIEGWPCVKGLSKLKQNTI